MTGMKRSDFLKLGSLFGGGVFGGLGLGLSSCSSDGDRRLDWTAVTGSMMDHEAPAIPKVRVAMIGLGNRGSSLIEMLDWLVQKGHAEITVLCVCAYAVSLGIVAELSVHARQQLRTK